MAQHVLLDNIHHHNVRLITQHGAIYGDNINQTLIFPSEYNEVQRHYPILFQRTDNGGFKSVALLGLDKDENLFLEQDQWKATYVPALQRVTPFLIGQPKPKDGEVLPENAVPMILINTDHPRISLTEGEPLFLPHGGHSQTLDHVIHWLNLIYNGAQLNEAMFGAFLSAGLLAPIELEIKLADNKAYILKDYFTISRDALFNLKGDVLEALNRSGFLALAFQVVASFSNLETLISLKNKLSPVK